MIKTKTNQPVTNKNTPEALAYDQQKVGDLVKQDTDGDGVPDWEENLYGTDPSKKDSNSDGISDSQEITKLKSGTSTAGDTSEDNGNKTQTDKFNSELFATVATLDESGPVDQNTVDQLTDSLSDKINNPTIRKIYTTSDIKITNDDSAQSNQTYGSNVNNLYKKYPIQGDVMDILGRFSGDENDSTVDASVLPELDPIITQTQNIIQGMTQISTPESVASAHLDFINALERLMENLQDIQAFQTDPIVSIGAINQYQQNTASLQSASDALESALNKN